MRFGRALLWLFLLLLVGGCTTGVFLMVTNDEGRFNWKTHHEEKMTEAEPGTEANTTAVVNKETDHALPEETETEFVEGTVPRPEIEEQLLTKNKWSRPGKTVKKVKYLVIHYLGNPGTTAQENRDYFESLKKLKNASMSANYIVGLDGEIIQCVPDNEVAYASNKANKESISIENCNVDSTGKFLKDTYISLVKLTAYLAEEYGLDREHIIRHHDVTGKSCPLYYVENEEAWEVFLDDVMLYTELCHRKSPDLEHLEKVLDGLDYTYDSKSDRSILSEEKENTEVGRPHDYEDASDNSGEGFDDYEEEEYYDEGEDGGDYSNDEHYEDEHYEDQYYEDSYANSYDEQSNQESGVDYSAGEETAPVEVPSEISTVDSYSGSEDASDVVLDDEVIVVSD